MAMSDPESYLMLCANIKMKIKIANYHKVCNNSREEKVKMKFFITIFEDEDGIFVAECPAIPGCISQGKTQKEAEKNIRKAIKECLEVRAKKGMP